MKPGESLHRARAGFVTLVAEKGEQIQHDILALAAAPHNSIDSAHVCVCNVCV